MHISHSWLLLNEKKLALRSFSYNLHIKYRVVSYQFAFYFIEYIYYITILLYFTFQHKHTRDRTPSQPESTSRVSFALSFHPHCVSQIPAPDDPGIKSETGTPMPCPLWPFKTGLLFISYI